MRVLLLLGLLALSCGSARASPTELPSDHNAATAASTEEASLGVTTTMVDVVTGPHTVKPEMLPEAAATNAVATDAAATEAAATEAAATEAAATEAATMNSTTVHETFTTQATLVDTDAPAHTATDATPTETDSPTTALGVETAAPAVETAAPTAVQETHTEEAGPDAKTANGVVVENGADEGMSSGQVVGIVIGVLVAVVIVIAVVIALLRRMGKYSP